MIVPVYNGEAFISRCIESLLRQDYPGLEIVVVDDGSTDRTCEQVKPPVRLVHTMGRKGAGAARNLGAGVATGNVLMFTDADCVVPVTWVSRAVETMQKHGVRCGGGGYAGPLGNTFVQWFAHEELAWRRRHLGGYCRTLVSNNIFCEANLFREHGGFPEFYCAASSEDMEFSWKVSQHEPLWWDPGNGIWHDYASTVGSYLRQQFRFARDAVPMFLGQVGLLGGKTHHGKQLYLEVACMGLAIVALLAGIWRLSVVFLACIAILNLPFLVFAARDRGVGFSVPALAMAYARNATIVWGCLAGLFRVIVKVQK